MKTRLIAPALVLAILSVGAWWLISPQVKDRAVAAETRVTQRPAQAASAAAPAPEGALTIPVATLRADGSVTSLEGESLRTWVAGLFAAAEDPETVHELAMPDGEKLQLRFGASGQAGSIQGEVIAPSPGRFTFATRSGTGELSFAAVASRDGSYAYHIERLNDGGVRLVAGTLSEVICATDDGGGLPLAPETGPGGQEIPII